MHVYFIKSPSSELVKIGYTHDLTARLLQLEAQAGEDLQLLRVLRGGKHEESWLHRLFIEHRVEGEWFNFSEAMLRIEVPHDISGENYNVSGSEFIEFFRHSINAYWKSARAMQRDIEAIGVRNCERSISGWRRGDNEPSASAVFQIIKNFPLGILVEFSSEVSEQSSQGGKS